jgi:hypothetical protein
MNSQRILEAITNKVHDLILFQGLDRDAAEARAISEVAKDLKLTPTSLASSITPTATTYVDADCDAEAKRVGAEVRRILLSDLNVEITGVMAEGDFGEYTDEMLADLVKQWGFDA